MDVLKTVRNWAGALSETIVSLLALSIVLQILMGGAAIPFLGEPKVIETVTGHLNALGGQGVVGLVAIWVLYSIWKARK
jgi:hypothetical protein